MQIDTPDRNSTEDRAVYHFGEFELRAESGELFRNGARVRMPEQSVQILLGLLENPGVVVSRDQLRERLWPDGSCVDYEHSLNAAVKRLRGSLGDDAESPRYIETRPKRGYRLVCQIRQTGSGAPTALSPDMATPTLLVETPESSSEPDAQPASKQPEAVKPRRGAPLLGAAIAIGLLILMASAIVTFRLRRNSATNPPPPQNSEAYGLFLRSFTYKAEFPENGQAVALLERSTALDPHSARSWCELARRYHFQYLNAGLGRSFLEQAREANRRALELAPDYRAAQLQKIVFDIDGGQLVPAYHAARAMIRARPQDPYGHYVLSYALRHGGMFEESARECELALKVDASPVLRACSLVYILLGRYDRAPVFLALDPLSSYAAARRTELGVLTNNKSAALEAARSIRVGPHDYPDVRLLESVLSGAPPEIVKSWSSEGEALNDRIDLPEFHFIAARYQAWAGQTQPALRLLRRAIVNNYCSYPVMDSDPLLANLRRLPQYKELRQAGAACRENFRSQIQNAP